jgi:hypothetical protein
MADRRPTFRVRLMRLTIRRRWNAAPGGSIRHRAFRLTSERPWWNWGRHLMIIVGQEQGGNYNEPEPGTWWYRLGPAKRQRRTGFPRHPLSTYQIVKDYSEFRRITEGLNEDQMYEWQAISVNQDGELTLGHRYWGGNFYGLRKCDVALLRRYLRHWRRIDWWGLRSWLYSQGLHAAVYAKKPFSCGARPGPGHGGYDHWSCHLRRGHEGMHRVNNYVWGEIDGEPIGAHQIPERVA